MILYQSSVKLLPNVAKTLANITVSLFIYKSIWDNVISNYTLINNLKNCLGKNFSKLKFYELMLDYLKIGQFTGSLIFRDFTFIIILFLDIWQVIWVD